MQRQNPYISDCFAILIYPFLHDFSNSPEKSADEILSNDRVTFWWERLKTQDRIMTAVDDIYFFLPHVSSVYFPVEFEFANSNQKIENFIKLYEGKVRKIIKENKVLRLTLNENYLSKIQNLNLKFEFHSYKFQLEFTIDWIDYFIFPFNIGFIAIKIKPSKPELSFDEFNDFIYHIRLIHPPKINWILPSIQVYENGKEINIKIRDLINYLLHILLVKKNTSSDADPITSISKFVSVNSHTKFTDLPFGQVYGQVFNILIYACPSEPLLNKESDSPYFSSLVEQLLYELSTITNTSDPNYIPDVGYKNKLLNDHSFAFFNNWKGVALHDNVLFLATEKSNFTLETLKHNVEFDYFHLYLYCLFLKLWTNLEFERIITQEDDLYKNLRKARKEKSFIIEFENKFLFSELTRKPIGNEIYKHYLKGLKFREIYNELSSQMKNLEEHYERRSQNFLNNVLAFLTFVGLPASILSQLFGSALIKRATWTEVAVISILLYLLSVILYLFLKKAYKPR